jgi:hypothetical protein
MTSYQPQSQNKPINAETQPKDQLDASRKNTAAMDAKVTKIATDTMRRGSGGSQN